MEEERGQDQDKKGGGKRKKQSQEHSSKRKRNSSSVSVMKPQVVSPKKTKNGERPHILEEESKEIPKQVPIANLDVPPRTNTCEQPLNEFIKLHPMLSDEIFQPRVLEQLDTLLEREPIRLSTLPVVDKTYEDAMLRPPNTDRGERPCNLGSSCLCVFMAKLRYGPKNPYGFVCMEFLLPEQRRAWLRGNKLPDEAGKCLVCNRYFTTYLYLMARNNAHFKRLTHKFEMYPYHHLNGDGNHEANAPTATASSSGRKPQDGRIGACPSANTGLESRPPKRSRLNSNSNDSSNAWHDRHATIQDLPTHVNSVGSMNGYRRDALLHMDEKMLQTSEMRTSSLANLAFQPFVRFSSTNFHYTMEGGSPRLLQVNVGERESIHSKGHLNTKPPPEKVDRAAANLVKATVPTL